jgi:hypothetical protein
MEPDTSPVEGAQDETEFADFERMANADEPPAAAAITTDEATDEADGEATGEGASEGADGEGESAGEGNEGDGEGDEGDGESPAPPRPKKTTQERINELTRARREAERTAERLEARLRELERSQEAPPPKEEAPKEEAPAAPNPDDFDYGEIDPRYISASVAYQTQQSIAAWQREEHARQQTELAERVRREAQDKFAAKVDEGSRKYDDFYEKVVIGAEKGEWPLSDEMGSLLVESDVGDDIAYHLASHPEEAVRVYRQTPVEQARYFGRLEAKFSAERTAATGNGAGKPAKRAPKAPPPVRPAVGAHGGHEPSAMSDDFLAFERRVNAQE